MQIETDILKARTGKISDRKGNFVRSITRFMGEFFFGELSADHQFGDLLLIYIRKIPLRDQFSVPHDRKSIAYFKQLRHFMRNINKTDAFRFQLAHNDKQPFDIPGRQSRRRLIHNNQVTLKQQSTGDFNQLLFGRLQVPNKFFRIDINLHSVKNFGCPFDHFLLI